MMTKKTKQRIWAFWKSDLNKQEAEDLLERLEKERVVMREQLESQFTHDPQEQEQLSSERSQVLLKAIQAKAGIDSTPVKRMYPATWQIAAAVLLLFGVFGLLYRAQYMPVAAPLVSNTTIVPSATYFLESDAQTKRYTLRDGSTLVLSPHSTVQYDRGYGVSNRKIKLIGEGRFSVKRDTTLPFEVTANGFTTTALGTEFIVNGSSGPVTEVKLLHGKIVVRSTTNNTMQIAETFLHVGDKLSINTQTKQVAFVQAQEIVTSTRPAAPIQVVPEPVTTDLNFQKTALSEVFDTIADRFDIQIDHDARGMNRMTFTGTFRQDDSPETIISIICRINNLVYEQTTQRSYVIRSVDPVAPHIPIILDTVKN